MRTAALPTESATRALLIDAAQDLVQLRGYNGFSYRDIAARVGIKTSSIHYHFPAKGDLVLALVSRYRVRFSAALEAIRARDEVPDAELERYLAMICGSFASNNLICLCGMLATDSHSLSPEIQAEIRGFFADNETYLAPLLERGRAAREFRFEGAAQLYATSLFAAMQGAMISAYTFGEAARVDAAAKWVRAALRG